ncbi:MAG: histidinol-phosphate transaminase [Bacteroidota bacterium]
MFDLNSLIRPHIISMKPYSSARDEYSGKEGVFLDANENSLGSVTHTDFSRYPDPLQLDLKLKMGPIFGLNHQNIFLGNGSDEPIDLLIRAFCRPGIDNIILLPPTYGMYKVSAVLNDIEIRYAPLTADFQLDTESILKNIDGNTKLIFLCSPNNPTGNLVDKGEIIKLIKSFNGVVVLDQAYADFAPEGDFTPNLDEFPNLVILKTFSKAWGMAGLRLGMAFASSQIIALLNKIKSPYNINQITQNQAIEALDNFERKNFFVQQLNVLKKNLIKQLVELPIVIKVNPSDTNYLLVKFKESAAVFSYLIDNKVIVRDRSAELNCEGCLRITVGSEMENQKLMALLQSYNG